MQGILHYERQLQKKQAVSLYLLICGLDDQDAADWEKDPKSNLLRSDPIQVMTKGTQVGRATVQEEVEREKEMVGSRKRTRHLRWRVRRKRSNKDFFQHFFQLCLFSLETRVKIILIKHRTQEKIIGTIPISMCVCRWSSRCRIGFLISFESCPVRCEDMSLAKNRRKILLCDFCNSCPVLL